ncbi:motility associated factor glycosyltransferase family protein [Candidatus Sulfurimonas marisnigri]|uniref:Motility associated factor glycosyltransferase family protein n=1 Tax=Candidatus Sulfurimonas marisnigri TaxID=2740405 RepID=A0A7S7M0B7_9BACT|nr:6-hydroxymethylpterin diphosphokinase MptE-like protein [Candidatus Sulfurimonas marisnigri]QOY54560.1 motility associated factor glycosyltransferase family protein [Candidatus Sulfurimonas marisnigri]
MKNIEDEAINTYQQNIKYLQESHPKLHQDLQNFELAIQNKHYEQQFDLEYIDNNFDIKEISTQKYMYGKKTNEISESITKNINFFKADHTIESFAMFRTSEEFFKTTQEHYRRARQHIYPIMNYYLENQTNNPEMKKIVKFIFLGVGLGLHLSTIDAKIQASNYLIIEDDIEIFKLSLFTCKYYELAKNAELTFSVLEDINAFTNTFTNFLRNAYIFNYKIKYFHLKTHSNVKLKHILSILSSQGFSFFPYQLQLDNSISALPYIKKKYRFLNVYKPFSIPVLQAKPILMLAAGPSLSNNIKWLKLNHNKFIIIAVSATLQFLHKYNIVPDIVTHVDGSDSVIELFEGFDAKEFLKDSLLLFSTQTKHNIVSKFDKNNIFMFETSASYFSIKFNYSSSCVGSFTYLFSLNLNAKSTYILGLDLSIDQDTGDDHLSDHVDHQSIDIQDKTKLETNVNVSSTLIPIEGNFQETIYTTPIFQTSISTISSFASKIANNNNIYNISHGAKIQNANPMNISDIAIDEISDINKQEVRRSIKECFSKQSLDKLSDNDLKKIKDRHDFITRIKVYLDEYANNISYSNYDIYQKNFLELSNKILSSNNEDISDLNKIYHSYFKYALAVIEDFFNTKNIKNTKRHIKKFDKMFQEGLHSISSQLNDAFNGLQNQ